MADTVPRTSIIIAVIRKKKQGNRKWKRNL